MLLASDRRRCMCEVRDCFLEPADDLDYPAPFVAGLLDPACPTPTLLTGDRKSVV